MRSHLIVSFGTWALAFSCLQVAAWNNTYDFVIVGGGTAGLTLAARLTENADTSVLVLEYGSPPDVIAAYKAPGSDQDPLGTQIDWNFNTVPQLPLFNRSITYNRGRCLGGSSAINGLTYMRGSSALYDSWAALGNDGWDWETVYPYFQKSTSFVPSINQSSSAYGGYDPSAYGNGPISVSYPQYVPPIGPVFVDAMAAIGINHTEELNAGDNRGAKLETLSSDGSKRVSAYDAFFVPIQNRTNLHVKIYAQVQQILLDTSNNTVAATGVVYSDLSTGLINNVTASKEVILSAGVFRSPQLLMLSGIGPTQQLDEYDLPVVVANDHVGQHMQDHAMFSLVARTQPKYSAWPLFTRVDLMQAAITEYNATGTGPLTATPAPAFAFEQLNTTELENLADGLISQNRTGQSHVEYVVESIFYPDMIMPNGVKPMFNESYITLSAVLIAPQSEGNVTLNGNQVSNIPNINPGWLSNQQDVQVQVRNLKKMRQILASQDLAAVTIGPNGGEVAPGVEVQSDEDIETYIRAVSNNIYHAGGTCRMMPKSAGGVVDSRLNVYGVKNLRVVDTSIFPIIPDAHTQGPVYMVAEKAADMIKEDWGIES